MSRPCRDGSSPAEKPSRTRLADDSRRRALVLFLKAHGASDDGGARWLRESAP